MATYHRQDGTIEFTNKQGALVGRLAGTKLTDVEVYRIAAHWWTPSWRAIVATAIALAESSGYVRAEGDLHMRSSSWGASVGLWQIRVAPGKESTMFDTADNAAAAHALWAKRGWMPWGAFKSGAYLKYLPRARAASKTGR